MTLTMETSMTDSVAPPILEIRDVAFAYGGVYALDGCSFSVPRGEVTGLIGPNGAGKSTLIEALSGFLTPSRGSIMFEGNDITGLGPARAARAGVIRTFQTARMLPRLPVIENVMIGAMTQSGENAFKALFRRRSWAEEEAKLRQEALDLLQWLGLQDHVNERAGTLSGGQRRLLEIARALMAHPKLLLLDEPAAGVFPQTINLIADRVREIAAGGVTVVMVAHNMNFLSRVADETVVMAQGKVLTRGSLDYVRSHSEVVAAYLGSTEGAR
jgi:ABC-type branched-subunit amino acid transport system ATPase component